LSLKIVRATRISSTDPTSNQNLAQLSNRKFLEEFPMQIFRPYLFVVTIMSVVPLATVAQETKPTAAQAPQSPAKVSTKETEVDKEGWKQLVAESSLEGWESTNFGGEGTVTVEVNYKKEFPKENFEIELEAQRVEGSDFLCGLTFPIGKEHLSFIAGGWGGGIVGLSSIDGFDASENSTTQFLQFKNGQWYRFKVRVDGKKVQAWVDNKLIVDQEREGHSFSLRGEVLASRPLGFCAFQSKVMVRNFRWRPVTQ
jgi:Domain of Unknown Function (DUF1080)